MLDTTLLAEDGSLEASASSMMTLELKRLTSSNKTRL